MVTMNCEEILLLLEQFTSLKQKEIPKELDNYLQHVAKTGDTIFIWSRLKYFFQQKLINVIENFYDGSRLQETTNHKNVAPFDYEVTKRTLLKRLDCFEGAPFTIQRLCELLSDPHKHYSHIDRFMLALEKLLFVVSTIEPRATRLESKTEDAVQLKCMEEKGDIDQEVPANSAANEGNVEIAGNEDEVPEVTDAAATEKLELEF